VKKLKNMNSSAKDAQAFTLRHRRRRERLNRLQATPAPKLVKTVKNEKNMNSTAKDAEAYTLSLSHQREGLNRFLRPPSSRV
jgi:hypothetical protein